MSEVGTCNPDGLTVEYLARWTLSLPGYHTAEYTEWRRWELLRSITRPTAAAAVDVAEPVEAA